MLSNNDALLKGCLWMNMSIVLNYLLWYINLSGVAPFLFISMYVLGLGFVGAALIHSIKIYWPVVLLIGALVVISFSTPTTAWDARSIWLFHAKRIFIDNNLFAQLDNYAAWSHNDYPVMMPVLSASIAKIVGKWNEIYPKISVIILQIPCLFILTSVLRKKIVVIFMCAGVILFCGDYLYNGFLDSVVAMYVVSLLVLILSSSVNKSFLTILMLSLQGVILCHLKNEGFVLYLIFIVVFVISYGIRFKFCSLFVPICLWILWKFACYRAGIENDVVGSNLTLHAIERIRNLDAIWLIAHSLMFRFWMISLLCGLIYYFVCVNKNLKKVILITSVFNILYFSVIYFIYISTPQDLIWHLQTSSDRVVIVLNQVAFLSMLFVFDSFGIAVCSRGDYESGA